MLKQLTTLWPAMNKRKILLLIKVPPPITGATLMNCRVLDSKILQNSFEFETIGMSYAKSINDMGTLRLEKIVLLIKYLSLLVTKLLNNKYCFVYFQISPHGSAFFRDILFVLLVKLSRIRIVYHLHGTGIKQHSKNFLYIVLYKFAFNNESVIILSKKLSYDIEDVYKGNALVVANGISNISYQLNTISKINNTLKILFLSNLLLSKGIGDFLEALSILHKKNIECKAIIIGAIGDINSYQLNNELNNKGLADKVEYLGPLYNSKKHEILAEVDILIYPTKNDAFPLVLLEALQYGLPTIATNEGAITEIIDDGMTGFIIDKGQPNKIAEKVEILYNDRELLRKMGEAGRKKFEANYSLEKFENNMAKVFQQVFDTNN